MFLRELELVELHLGLVDFSRMKVKMDCDGYERMVKKVVSSLAGNHHILNLAHNKSNIHAFIDKFVDSGLTSLAIAYYQEFRERPKESPGGLWQFIGLMSLCHLPRHDSADTFQRGFESWGKCKNDYRCFWFAIFLLF
ncbi:putative P-type H(+)-exporting transporter [Helianthus anomalus]